MKHFYKKLIDVFENPVNKTKFTELGITAVTYIDLYAQQEQFEENFELFGQPTLLVDWQVAYSGMESQGKAVVTLYCCYEQLRDTSNISLNRELGLKFLDYVAVIDEVARTIESETTGKLDLVSEGFHKMDSIVDVYVLTYECNYKDRKKPLEKYEGGDYDILDLSSSLNLDVAFD